MTVKRGHPVPIAVTTAATTAAAEVQAASIAMATSRRRRGEVTFRSEAAPEDGADEERPQCAEAGGHGEPGRTGRREPDEDHVPRHVGGEDVPEAEKAHRIDEAAHDGQGGQRHHQGLGWAIGLAHVRSTFPATVDGHASVKVTEATATAGDRSPP